MPLFRFRAHECVSKGLGSWDWDATDKPCVRQIPALVYRGLCTCLPGLPEVNLTVGTTGLHRRLGPRRNRRWRTFLVAHNIQRPVEKCGTKWVNMFTCTLAAMEYAQAFCHQGGMLRRWLLSTDLFPKAKCDKWLAQPCKTAEWCRFLVPESCSSTLVRRTLFWVGLKISEHFVASQLSLWTERRGHGRRPEKRDCHEQ